MVEGVAAVTAELARQAAAADLNEAGSGEPPAEAPPPPPPAPPPPPPPALAGVPPASGYSRSSKSVKVLGGAAPLAVAALALALSDGDTPVTAKHHTPTVSVSAGGPAAAPIPPRADLPSPPKDFLPAECLKQFQIDFPHHRGDDVARRQTKVCREGYLLSFNVDTQSPDWVMERLSQADLVGPAKRTNKFLDDPKLVPDADSDNADYLKTGFDRGHQAPAADAKFSQRVMDESFYFTNMSPQRGIGMNRGAWKFLEEATRSWVMCGGHPDLYVITGPIYGTLEGNPRSIGNPPVAVPRAYYKIVYDAQLGRAVGFVLPNTKIGSRIDLQDYVWKIADIETETGLNFFRTLDQRTQAQMKDNPGVAWEHRGACPGDTGD
ncbi:MAG TPA: DNA/RNA non-specific endonuclease [Allosphingosinicella sp.]